MLFDIRVSFDANIPMRAYTCCTRCPKIAIGGHCGGWPFVLEERISYEFSNLISRFGNTLNVDLVELLILQTLKNENVIFDAAEHREGGSDGNY